MPRQTARANRQQEQITYRTRVLTVIESFDGWLTGQQIATATGLTYKQAIDALNALNNMERVARTGRKFTARWGRIGYLDNQAANESIELLSQCFRNFFK